MIVDRLEQRVDGAGCELSARVRSEAGYDRRLWYRFPADFAQTDALDASPFVPALIQHALWGGEDLAIDGAVSTQLLRGTSAALDIYETWYPRLRRPVVKAEAGALRATGTATGCFFTRGVDSWFSVLRDRAFDPDAPGTISTLITVPDFHFLYSESGRREALEANRRLADALACRLVVVESNYGDVPRPAFFTRILGPALSGVGLLLGAGIRRVIMASSHSVAGLIPWNSHPLTDPLWSTEAVEIVHDGAEVSRVDKVIALKQSGLALSNLRVCDARGATSNCGRCEKCIRTLVALRIAGVTGNVPFDERLSLRRLLGVAPAEVSQRDFWLELADHLGGSPADRRLAAGVRLGLFRYDVKRARRSFRELGVALDEALLGGRLRRTVSRIG